MGEAKRRRGRGGDGVRPAEEFIRLPGGTTTLTAVMNGCMPGLMRHFEAWAGEGRRPDEMAGLVTERQGTPPGVYALEHAIYLRADMQADFDHPDRSEALRDLGHRLRAWRGPGPDWFPVVVALGDLTGILPLRILAVGAGAWPSKGGRA